MYDTKDVIFALATPWGNSAIAVIRISGEGSIQLLSKVFSRPDALLKAKSHTVVHGKLVDSRSNRTVDEVLVTVFRHGRGYTAEEGADISMHGSTERMVRHLVAALEERGVKTQLFDLSVTDIGKLAMSLVDAATIVIGTPTVHVGPHPAVYSATHLANALRPKLKHAAVIGSYGWGTKAVEQLTGLIPNLKVEVLGAVLCKGLPKDETLAELDALADTIRDRHAALAGEAR